jgi:uncharacterized protein YndB with AHSA1/START domain
VHGALATRAKAVEHVAVALQARAEIEIPKPAPEVFDLATACAGFPRFLLRLGPIPAVVRAELVGASEPKAGGRRQIELGDGSRIEEEILAFERPSRHRYRWLNPPAPPFSWLVRGAEGDWTFTSVAGGTRVAWTYRFEARSAVAAVLARPVVLLFGSWMRRGLANLRTLLAG